MTGSSKNIKYYLYPATARRDNTQLELATGHVVHRDGRVLEQTCMTIGRYGIEANRGKRLKNGLYYVRPNC